MAGSNVHSAPIVAIASIFATKPGLFGRIFVALAVGWMAAGWVQAQPGALLPSAEISGVASGRNEYDYTLTLDNKPASTKSIESFWFAWGAGDGNFLDSIPTKIQSPNGWVANVTHAGEGDGYGILFETGSAPLAPGSSVVFTFSLPDAPATLLRETPFYPGDVTLSASVYSGQVAGQREPLVVQLVPEPSSLALAGLGALALAAQIARPVAKRLQKCN